MKLDEAIVDNFDAAALAELAAGLGISFEEPDAALAARAVALVEALAAAGRAADLLDALSAARPGISWAELPYPAATLRRLHAALCRRHTLDSLRTLAFRLGLDFDELPGDTKSARARELVLAMDRQGRAAELVIRYPPRQAAGGPRLSNGRSFDPAVVRRVGLRLAAWVGRPARSLPLAWLAALFLLTAGLSAADRSRPAASGLPSVMPVVPEPSGAARPAGIEPPPGAARPSGGAELFPAGSPWPTPTASPAAQTPAATATDDLIPRQWPTVEPVVLVGERGANLRRGPGPEYDVVATLRAGARLALRAVSPTGEWYQVRLPGKGWPWVDARYATLISGGGGAPVATGEPPADGTAAPPSPAPARPTAAASQAAVAPYPTAAATPSRPAAHPSATPPAPTIPAPTVPPP